MPLRKIRRPKGAGTARTRGYDDVPTKSAANGARKAPGAKGRR